MDSQFCGYPNANNLLLQNRSKSITQLNSINLTEELSGGGPITNPCLLDLFWKQWQEMEKQKCMDIGILIHLFPIHAFSTTWKQKTLRYSDVFIRKRKGAFETNGLFLFLYLVSTIKKFMGLIIKQDILTTVGHLNQVRSLDFTKKENSSLKLITIGMKSLIHTVLSYSRTTSANVCLWNLFNVGISA